MPEHVSYDIAPDITLQQAIEKFWEAFPPVWNRIRGHLRMILTEHFDITIEDFHILRNLRQGNCSVSQLADVQGISRPAASQAVDGLVEKGLVSRHYDTEDRRHIRLELTPSGDELLNTIFQQNRGWMMEKMASFTPEEVAAFAKVMDALKSAFIEAGA